MHTSCKTWLPKVVLGVITVLSLFANSFALPVESASNTIYILLNTQTDNNENNQTMWANTGIKDRVRSLVGKDDGHIYTYSYNLNEQAPDAFAKEYFVRTSDKSIQELALQNWFKNSADIKSIKKTCSCSTLADLKKKRPDLVPSNFVVIADGAAGLAVREFIQSKDYTGDISQVMFFNTPQEGTGFADQSIFNGTDKLDDRGDVSKYAGLIPLALVAYVAGDIDGLKEMMISLMKDAVMNLAYNMGSIKNDDFKNLFDGYSEKNMSSWYLTQDADERDDKYISLINDASKEYLGATQLLNSYSKNNDYEHPSYNIVYSYGLPTIGNGRRTLPDFMDMYKNHISTTKLAEVLADSIKNKYSKEISEATNFAKSLIDNDNISDVLGQYKEYYNYATEISSLVNGISEFRKLDLNKDDIPGSAYKLYRFIDKYIPDTYKSEVYLMFMKYFTSETIDAAKSAWNCVSDMKECVKEGLGVAAENLANYSLNFYNDGAFDIPLASAIGENVSAFKEATVARAGYELNDILDNVSNFSDYKKSFSNYAGKLDQLKDYQTQLSSLGSLESDRQIVDFALDVACTILNDINTAYGKICNAAEFATNVTLVGVQSTQIKKLVGMSKNLKTARDVALMASAQKTNTITLNSIHSKSDDNKDDNNVTISDFEKSLFTTPKVSFASIHDDKGDVVPLLMQNPCQSGDIYDWNSFKTVCSTAKDGKIVEPVTPKMNLTTLWTSSSGSVQPMGVKDVFYNNGVKNVQYWAATPYTVDGDALSEYRFIIDDVQPDSIRWIKFDFNTRAQIIYERTGTSTWNVYFELDYKENGFKKVLQSSPISKDGLFILKPEEVIEAYNNSADVSSKFASTTLSDDGVNMVYVSAMNKIGLITNESFSYFFKATEFNFNAEWPFNLAHLSELDEVSANINNMGYSQYQLDGARIRVSRIENGVAYKDSAEVESTDLISAEKWRTYVNLKTALKELDTDVEGTYFLEWVWFMKDENATPASYDTLTLKSMFYVDKTAPGLSLKLPKKNLTGLESDGEWADIITVDEKYEPTRAMRGLLVDQTGHVITIFNKTRHSAKHFELDGNLLKSILSSGMYTFYVQAFDFASPNLEAYNKLLDINDENNEFWNDVIDGLNFKEGYNGITLSENIWIDKDAPRIESGSVQVASVVDTTTTSCDSTHMNNGQGLVFNACNLVSTSFKIHEDLINRDSSIVKVNIVFTDANAQTGKFTRVFDDVVKMVKSDSVYSFIEPLANKVKDGKYDISVELIDEAGNSTSEVLAKDVAIDRKAPSVYYLSSGTLAYESIDELANKKVKAYVAQNMDDSRNVSTLNCLKKLIAANDTVDWTSAGEIKYPANGDEQQFEYSISDMATGKANGSWVVYLKCYDVAGNFDTGLDFFGMGARYPRITYPNDSINSMYYGKVLIKGITPNPDLHGDDNKVSYRLDWKEEASSTWLDTGFVYLSSGESKSERDLAIWTVDKNVSGKVTLRLSIKSCEACEEKSYETTVEVYQKLDVSYGKDTTEIELGLPTSQIAGESVDNLSISLKHVSDTSTWKVNAKIKVKLNENDQEEIVAHDYTFDPAVVSPFDGVPITYKDGLNIWQNGDIWNIYWQGSAKGVIADTSELKKRLENKETWVAPENVARAKPVLTLKYLNSGFAFISSTGDGSLDSAKIPAMEVDGIKIPKSDSSLTWNLDDYSSKTLYIQFKADSAFTIDLSSVEDADSIIFCGQSNRPAYDAISSFKGVGTVYVHPEQYRMNFTWSGLTDGGIIPEGTTASVYAVAYNKQDPSKIIAQEKPWNLTHGKISLTSDDKGPGILLFNLNATDDLPVKRDAVSFSYGLHGRAAYVTEEVIGPNGEVVKTIKSKTFTYAGKSNTANRVSWIGDDNTSHVVDEFGEYKFVVSAYENEADSKPAATYEYKFELKDGGGFIDVATLEGDGASGYSIDLSMDEAYLDEEKDGGKLRYAGNIDYLMKVDASYDYLPEEQRAFYYKWEPYASNGKATQEPAFYNKYRYSLGIHRHRNTVPITIAAILMGEHFYFNSDGFSECDTDDNDHPYVIRVFRAAISENTPFSFNIIKSYDNDVFGYNSWTKEWYKNYVAVKILPASAYEDIHNKLANIGNGFSFNPNYTYTSYSSLEEDRNSKDVKAGTSYKAANFKNNTGLNLWVSNFGGNTVLWETEMKDFEGNDANFSFEKENSQVSPCASLTLEKNVSAEKSVCPPQTPDEEKLLNEYNPHNDMAKVTVNHLAGKENFTYGSTSTNSICSGYRGSPTSLGANITVEIKPDYWDPEKNGTWGMNNLANRYVRFDPTNSTLFGNNAYIDVLNGDYKNFYGTDGWIKETTGENTWVSPFEAVQYPMARNGSNPLLFGDETSQGSKVYPSSFVLKNFSLTNNFFTFIEYEGEKYGYNPKHFNDETGLLSIDYGGTPRIFDNPLNVKISTAVGVSPSCAIQQNADVVVDFPYKDSEKNLKTFVDKQLPGLTQDKEYIKYVFYSDERARVFRTLNGWSDDDWLKCYVSYGLSDGYILNPVISSLISVPMPQSCSLPENTEESVLNYTVQGDQDVKNGKLWNISYDKLSGKPKCVEKKAGVTLGMSNCDFKPVLVDKNGNTDNSSYWIVNQGEGNISSNPDKTNRSETLNYIFSKDHPSFDPDDLNHSVSVNQLLSQNENSEIKQDRSWILNLEYENPRLFERTENINDDNEDDLTPHKYLNVKTNSNNEKFDVAWTGVAPTLRQSEIGTLRGRVPGEKSPWKIFYVSNGYTHALKDSAQEAYPKSEPYPILARVDMKALQGNTSFFLTYGGTDSKTYYRKLDILIGKRVNPTESSVIQSMYGNVDVAFNKNAWGDEPVDVTVRTVAANENVTRVYGDLPVTGPVIEVLPSHDFGDDEDKWPEIKVKLTWDDVGEQDVNNIKIYKANFDEGVLTPITYSGHECFATNKNGADELIDCSQKWDYVLIKGKTKTFSSFVAMDEAKAEEANALSPSNVIEALNCVQPAIDTVWMGTSNGWLGYKYPCGGRSNYILQLLFGSSVAAEHQGVSAETIVWNAKQSDVWLNADIYNSRLEFFGVDGTTDQLRGPYVRVDSVAPTVKDVNYSIVEEGADRSLSVSANLVDHESGIGDVIMYVYYGSALVDSFNIYGKGSKDTTITRDFNINGNILRHCIGCSAQINVSAYDLGHNVDSVEERTEDVYPYPSSLVIWYPLSEGMGSYAHEALNANMDMSLTNVSSPWRFGSLINFSQSTDYTVSRSKVNFDESSNFSVEFRGRFTVIEGKIVSGSGSHPWEIGVKNKKFYVSDGSKSVAMSAVGSGVTRHYAFVFDGKNVSLYEDGVFKERKTLSKEVPLAGDLGIALGDAQKSSNFRMDDLRIYKSALTAEQISTLYHYEYTPDEKDIIFATRASEIVDHEGLILDQSCGLPGKAYLRQKSASSKGWINWTVDADAGDYALYMYARGYASEKHSVEVKVNDVNLGTFTLASSGQWESVLVGENLKFDLTPGENVISIRPASELGVAGIAVVSSASEFSISKLDFGQSTWMDPEPQVSVQIFYENSSDKTWARPHILFHNLTGKSFSNTHFRYFYDGEGSAVEAKLFWPEAPMSLVAETGSVYYADLAIADAIEPYGSLYGTTGLQLGLHRNDYYFDWYIYDDPSYEAGAESGYVNAKGVALLDEDGALLNEWSCYDDGSSAERPRVQVRALAKDESNDLTKSSTVQAIVENNGVVAIEGFEIRYYYRDAEGTVADPDIYSSAFATTSFANVGGDLNYVSFKYDGVVLNPGERSSFGNGVKFALHNKNWQDGFNSTDDPSHYNLNNLELVEADSIIILDANGNLLWGNVPQPKFASNYKIQLTESRITRDGDVIYVEIDEAGHYTLEVVDAIGTPLDKLFDDTWDIGEHVVTISNSSLKAGSYIVLRKGTTILNWQILK